MLKTHQVFTCPCNMLYLPQGGMDLFVVVIYAFMGSIQPWMAMVACRKFYKVDCLTVVTRISHKYQVLLARWDTDKNQDPAIHKLTASVFTISDAVGMMEHKNCTHLSCILRSLTISSCDFPFSRSFSFSSSSFSFSFSRMMMSSSCNHDSQKYCKHSESLSTEPLRSNNC